jgi:heme exporter protein C
MSPTATISPSPAGGSSRQPEVTSTGTRATRILGILVLIGFGWLALFGLVFSPRDEVQKDWVRFLYLHVGSIFLSYVAFGVTACCSALFLWKRTRSLVWDRVAGASAEIGVLFLCITLITGSLWGKGTWGVYWTWDARLTTTALLLVLFIGYLALRGIDGDRDVRAKRAAIAGLVAAADIPIVNQAINWWRTLHQGRTFRILGEATIDGLMLFSVFVALIAFALLYVWLLIHRLRIAQMEEILEAKGLELAIADRLAEAEPVSAP